MNRELYREQVMIEAEISTALQQPAAGRSAVGLLWEVSQSGRSGRTMFSARRPDSWTDSVVEIQSSTIAGLAQLMQRFALGYKAQTGELTAHDAEGWRTMREQRDRLEHQVRDLTAQLERAIGVSQ